MYTEPFLMLPLIIAILISASLVFYYLRIKHTERMGLIKVGLNVINEDSLTYLKYSVLSKGIFLICLGIGLLVAKIITVRFDSLNNFLTYLIALLLFGGIGLLVYYRVLRSKI